MKKIEKKQRLPPTSYDTSNWVLLNYYLFLKTFFGMKAPNKRGVDAVQSGLLNMSDQEENVWVDCLVHVFWWVLDDNCRHFSNPLSKEAAQARYMDPKSFRILGTWMGHMTEKLACNEPLMNMSVPRQWIGRGATSAARYQSVGPISKYHGVWKPPAGYPPYVPKK